MLRTLQAICCASLVVAVGCTESYKPDVSTETGNPPVIDGDKIALVVTRDEVHVQGEPGAVTPPEGAIEVKVLRNQGLVRGPIEDDGSFDVVVDATLDDVFEVRAVNGDGSSAVVIIVRGGAMVGADGGTELSCEQRGAIVASIVDPLVEGASKSCAVDADCAVVEVSNACTGGCGRAVVAALDADAIDEARIEASALWCGDEYESCPTPDIECGVPLAPICDDGLCAYGGNEPVGCETCLGTTITWRITSAGDLPAFPATNTYTLNDCNTLSIVDEAGETCSNDVLRCNDGGDVASIEKILATLTSEDVTAAIEEGGSHGPADFGLRGHFMSITIGDKTFMYRTCWDENECEWPGLQALALMLIELGSIDACMPGAGGSDCTSDFDIGDCDAAIPVWWHNPATGTCEMRTYGGCGGNDNNYDSLAACAQACNECPPNRVTVEECITCGLGGGCAETGEHCALVCSADADCEGEQGPAGFDTHCADGACRTELLGCI